MGEFKEQQEAVWLEQSKWGRNGEMSKRGGQEQNMEGLRVHDRGLDFVQVWWGARGKFGLE